MAARDISVRLTAQLTENTAAANAKHYHGRPPELAGGVDTRVELARPAYLTTEETSEGVFLCRFTSDGRPVGDTRHRTVAEAKDQAQFEYGDALEEVGRKKCLTDLKQ